MTDRQTELLEAALDIVSREGFSRLTIRNVAARVGITEPALYRHFESKLELMAALLSYLEARLAPYFQDFADHSETLETGFQTLITRLFGELEARPAFAAFLFADEAFHSEPGLRPALSDMFRRNQAVVLQALSSLQKRSLIRTDLPPANLALVVMGCLRLTINRWHMDPAGLSLSERQNLLVSTLVPLLSP